jgi:hypothetical protein
MIWLRSSEGIDVTRFQSRPPPFFSFSLFLDFSASTHVSFLFHFLSFYANFSSSPSRRYFPIQFSGTVSPLRSWRVVPFTRIDQEIPRAHATTWSQKPAHHDVLQPNQRLVSSCYREGIPNR